MGDLVGHMSVRGVLGRLINRGKLPSTMLFTGPEGVGKAFVAREAGRHLLCEDEAKTSSPGGCGKCTSCLLIASNNHPDFIFGDARSEAFGEVDTLRGVIRQLSLKSFRGRGRAVILDNAEHLSQQALNLLLKSLEEPRPLTWYILIASNPGRFPSTIPSRCTTFSFGNLTPADLEIVFSDLIREGKYPSTIAHEELLALSEGKVTDPELLQQRINLKESIAEFHDLFASSNLVDSSLALTHLLKNNKDSLLSIFALLRISARERMRQAMTNELAQKWSNHLSNVLLAEKLSNDRNLNSTYLLTAALVLGHAGEEDFLSLQAVIR